MTPQLTAALDAVSHTIFGCVEILLPGYNLRLLDGAGQITFGGKTFYGHDATFGTLAACEQIDDGAGDEAPALQLTFHPASDAAAATLAAPTMQGSLATVWLGALDITTGLVVPDPEIVFIGELDVPRLIAGEGKRSLELELVSASERFFADDEGARLSDTFHKYLFPGELGLAFTTGVEEQIYWGSEAPAGGVSYGGGGSGRGFRDAINAAL
jgi:hypothetical protein